jgi:hypothetical protein
MWCSNSLASWLLVRSGHDVADLRPPADGRAPGWTAGLTVAARTSAPVTRLERGDYPMMRRMLLELKERREGPVTSR